MTPSAASSQLLSHPAPLLIVQDNLQNVTNGAGWNSSSKTLLVLFSTEAQEKPLPASPSLVPYPHVPREGELARRRVSPIQCLNRELPRRLPVGGSRVRQKSIRRSNLQPRCLCLAGTATSTCARMQTLAKERGFQIQPLQTGENPGGAGRSAAVSQHCRCSSSLPLHPPALQLKPGLYRFPASHLKATAAKTRERQSRALPALGGRGREHFLGHKQVHVAPRHRSWLGWEPFSGRGWKVTVMYPPKWKGTVSPALRFSIQMTRASAVLEALDGHLQL